MIFTFFRQLCGFRLFHDTARATCFNLNFFPPRCSRLLKGGMSCLLRTARILGRENPSPFENQAAVQIYCSAHLFSHGFSGGKLSRTLCRCLVAYTVNQSSYEHDFKAHPNTSLAFLSLFSSRVPPLLAEEKLKI